VTLVKNNEIEIFTLKGEGSVLLEVQELEVQTY
jgi:hypothetical protein